MKSPLFLALCLLLLPLHYSAGQSPRFVSVACTNQASIEILDGEVGELITRLPYGTGSDVSVTKDGVTWPALPASNRESSATASVVMTGVGTTIAGPATFKHKSPYGIMTVKISPFAYDPNKTLILPPGTNQVFVALESSTNLVHWVDATNGVYGSPDTARFFRIRSAKLSAP